MPTICGLESFIRELNSAAEQRKNLQLTGSSDSFSELSILKLFSQADVGAQKLVVILPHAKDFGPWIHELEINLKKLQRTDPNLSKFEYAPPISILPYFSLWGRDRLVNPSLSRRQRLYALSLINQNAPSIIITTLQGLFQKTLTPSELSRHCLMVKKGDERSFDDFISTLGDLGFHKSSVVEEEGCYAIRGGLIDIFSSNYLEPLRIDFVGDEIASIRLFSPNDQKSTHNLDHAVIYPTSETVITKADQGRFAQQLYNTLLEKEILQADRDGIMEAFERRVRFSGFDLFTPCLRDEHATCFDFLGKEDLLIFPKSITSCIEQYDAFLKDIKTAFDLDIAASRASLSPDLHFHSNETVTDILQKFPYVEFGNPFSSDKASFVTFQSSVFTKTLPMPTFSSDGKTSSPDLFEKWCDIIKTILEKAEGSIAILAHHEEQITRIQNLLSHRDFQVCIEPHIMQNIVSSSIEPMKLYVGFGDLSSFLWLEENRLLIIPEQVLFGAPRRKPKPASAKLQNYLSSFKDLNINDCVVHVQHGIGRYLGMTSLSVSGLDYDFLILEYAGGDKIYLPVDRLNLLQRYSAGDSGESSDNETGAKSARRGHPQLDKLGSGTWEKKKSKVKKAVHDMADELLKLQAKRAVSESTAFSAPSESYYRFEADFPYEETEDQLRALSEVNYDLSISKPMDRLICGDVGFGKTEIALRATYRAVLDGYQVLVLVPTTVLCYQHYRTFVDRLAKHGVSVGYASRFVDTETLKQNVKALEQGQLDVLIGTHRLLSQDIKPKKLGLLVIDEEQRFGVGHKERLKKLRAGTDIITLTATPIPRTLHMSMLGLRDISIIATPPHDRLAVKTYVSKFDESLIQEALKQEINRGGQAFFVHNRVDEISEIATYIQKLVPEATVRFAHGQMPEKQLERVIADFLDQKFPILVCTTIIESGIDMPNVNTMIINRAERFGLAQLYQLRGRVGRSSVQAYAYLLTSNLDTLSDEAQKRLDIIAAHQDLGSGFQIASHDLEIRGAGNLLGGEQSGHIASVGLEMYTDMLQAAILDIKGEPQKETSDVEIKIPISAVISKSYIQSENARLHIYKRLFSSESEDELIKLRQEVEDRFGPIPAEVNRLFYIGHIKQKLIHCNALSLTMAESGFFEIKFSPLKEKQIDIVIRLCQHHPDKYRLSPDYRLFLLMKAKKKPSSAEQDDMMLQLSALIDPMAQDFEALES